MLSVGGAYDVVMPVRHAIIIEGDCMNKLEWFEIPATNFQRAVDFYQRVFDVNLNVRPFGPFQMGVFGPNEGAGVGCVIHGEGYVPGADGVVIYLDANPSIDAVLARIVPAGGTIKSDKVVLPENHGVIAYFVDTEGNRLGLHALA